MEKLYCVMFQGINLYNYKMKPQEISKAETLRNELINICDSLNVPRDKLYDGRPYMGRLKDNSDYLLKYKENIGYYVLHGERGIYRLQEGFPTKEKHDATYMLLEYEFKNGGYIYECENRGKLQEEWTKKYNLEYDFRKAAFEYSLVLLKTVFDVYPDNVITEYTNYMNRWFSDRYWNFDKDTMSFEAAK